MTKWTIKAIAKRDKTKPSKLVFRITLKDKNYKMQVASKEIVDTDLRHIARQLHYFSYTYDFEVPKDLQKKLNKYRKELL